MIKTGNPVISIYTEMTPNPETMKFVANKLLYPGKSIDFQSVEAAKPSPLAIELQKPAKQNGMTLFLLSASF
jgi:hypothetical protein